VAYQQIRHRKKRRFLEAYAENGNVTLSAQAAGVFRTTHYDWLEADPEYAAAFHQAEEESADRLEKIARDRAAAGSDTLLIFLLKGIRPDKYADRLKVDLRRQEIHSRAEALAAELGAPVEDIERDLVLAVEAARG
jgi:hypothetical protein